MINKYTEINKHTRDFSAIRKSDGSKLFKNKYEVFHYLKETLNQIGHIEDIKTILKMTIDFIKYGKSNINFNAFKMIDEDKATKIQFAIDLTTGNSSMFKQEITQGATQFIFMATISYAKFANSEKLSQSLANLNNHQNKIQFITNALNELYTSYDDNSTHNLPIDNNGLIKLDEKYLADCSFNNNIIIINYSDHSWFSKSNDIITYNFAPALEKTKIFLNNNYTKNGKIYGQFKDNILTLNAHTTIEHQEYKAGDRLYCNQQNIVVGQFNDNILTLNAHTTIEHQEYKAGDRLYCNEQNVIVGQIKDNILILTTNTTIQHQGYKAGDKLYCNEQNVIVGQIKDNILILTTNTTIQHQECKEGDVFLLNKNGTIKKYGYKIKATGNMIYKTEPLNYVKKDRDAGGLYNMHNPHLSGDGVYYISGNKGDFLTFIIDSVSGVNAINGDIESTQILLNALNTKLDNLDFRVSEKEILIKIDETLKTCMQECKANNKEFCAAFSIVLKKDDQFYTLTYGDTSVHYIYTDNTNESGNLNTYKDFSIEAIKDYEELGELKDPQPKYYIYDSKKEKYYICKDKAYAKIYQQMKPSTIEIQKKIKIFINNTEVNEFFKAHGIKIRQKLTQYAPENLMMQVNTIYECVDSIKIANDPAPKLLLELLQYLETFVPMSLSGKQLNSLDDINDVNLSQMIYHRPCKKQGAMGSEVGIVLTASDGITDNLKYQNKSLMDFFNQYLVGILLEPEMSTFIEDLSKQNYTIKFLELSEKILKKFQEDNNLRQNNHLRIKDDDLSLNIIPTNFENAKAVLKGLLFIDNQEIVGSYYQGNNNLATLHKDVGKEYKKGDLACVENGIIIDKINIILVELLQNQSFSDEFNNLPDDAKKVIIALFSDKSSEQLNGTHKQNVLAIFEAIKYGYERCITNGFKIENKGLRKYINDKNIGDELKIFIENNFDKIVSFTNTITIDNESFTLIPDKGYYSRQGKTGDCYLLTFLNGYIKRVVYKNDKFNENNLFLNTMWRQGNEVCIKLALPRKYKDEILKHVESHIPPRYEILNDSDEFDGDDYSYCIFKTTTGTLKHISNTHEVETNSLGVKILEHLVASLLVPNNNTAPVNLVATTALHSGRKSSIPDTELLGIIAHSFKIKTKERQFIAKNDTTVLNKNIVANTIQNLYTILNKDDNTDFVYVGIPTQKGGRHAYVLKNITKKGEMTLINPHDFPQKEEKYFINALLNKYENQNNEGIKFIIFGD